MRYRLLGLTIAVVLFVWAPVHTQDLLFDSLRDYLESLRVQAGIPGLSVAVVGTTDILWEHAFGQQDLERAIPTRTDTPFHLDGLTQVVTAVLVLGCVEEGRLSLDDRIGQFAPDSPDADASIRDLLAHTTRGLSGRQFAYRPDRLDPLSSAVTTCAGNPLRGAVGALFDRLGMTDSVPGADVAQQLPHADHALQVERYRGVLGRLATPYAVERGQRPVVSQYPATTLTPAAGLISSVRDIARFDLELRNGILVRAETLALAWNPPLDASGDPLPHGLGWFVQSYNGEPIVWQFGVGENASSSLLVTAPVRGLTLILMANSDGLVKPFRLAEGDLTLSPFARLFLELFVR